MTRRAAASAIPQGPFSGVPFLCKDLVSAIAGVPMTKGSKSCRNYVPSFDSEMARRFRAAGLIVLGKTNTPEFGLMGITEPELHGPDAQPLEPDHTPGGPSGGLAASVAAASPAGFRRRRRRIDPHPLLVLRPLRPQAHLAAASGRGPNQAKFGRARRWRAC